MYILGDELVFPAPDHTTEDGLLAVGGDMSPERLLLAYRQGIFPWPTEGYPLLWFSPDPRFVLDPTQIHVGRSLRREMRRGRYRVTADQAFEQVIRACGEAVRPYQDGTWINEELIRAYIQLHKLGYAHSVETWLDGVLVGGLYGVALGRGFAGESMFSRESDASKVGFVTLVGQLLRWDFRLIDCQVRTEHLARFGAQLWPRTRFLAAWQEATSGSGRRGAWRFEVTPEGALGELSA